MPAEKERPYVPGLGYHGGTLAKGCFMAHVDDQRVARVLDALETQHPGAQLLVNDPWSIYYLTGFYADMFERFCGVLLARDAEPVILVNALHQLPEYDNARVAYHTDTDIVADAIAREVDPTKPLGIDTVMRSGFLMPLMDRHAASEFFLGDFAVTAARTNKDAAGDEDWTPYCQEKVALTNEYQTFTKEFQMKEDTDPDTIFNIPMGAIDGQQIKEQHRICIDDIVLEKMEVPEIKPEETGKNLLVNGDFSDGNTGWDIVKRDDAIGTTVATEGGIVFKIADVGTEDWHAQLKQSGITLEKGCKYRVKFKVTSTKARTIKLGFMSESYDWNGGTNLELPEAEEQEVVYEFTMEKDTDRNAVMTVSMGQIYENDDKNKPINTPASDIILTNFSLEKIGQK